MHCNNDFFSSVTFMLPFILFDDDDDDDRIALIYVFNFGGADGGGAGQSLSSMGAQSIIIA